MRSACRIHRRQGAQGASFAPAFYAFQNGARFASVDESVRFIKGIGYQGVGSVNPNELAELKAACDKVGLKISSIFAGGKVNADGFDYGKDVSEAIAMLKETDALVELNVERGKDPNDGQAIAFVKEIADKAKDAGLKVRLYPHADFHIERVAHALRIARATGRDSVGVIFNLCHFLKVQPKDDLAATLEESKPLLWSVSVCGAVAGGTDWSALIRSLDEGTSLAAAPARDRIPRPGRAAMLQRQDRSPAEPGALDEGVDESPCCKHGGNFQPLIRVSRAGWLH